MGILSKTFAVLDALRQRAKEHEQAEAAAKTQQAEEEPKPAKVEPDTHIEQEKVEQPAKAPPPTPKKNTKPRERRMKAIAPKSLDEIQASIESIRSAQREREAASKPTPPPTAKVIQLPACPDEARNAPNVALRSALFAAVARGPRRFLKDAQIASPDGISIMFSGEQLDQTDLSIYLSLLHLAKETPLGDTVTFTGYSFLKAMGKSDTGGNRKVIDERLRKLRATAISVKVGKVTYIGGLIDAARKNEETKAYEVKINPAIRDLFAPDQFTQLDWKARQLLEGKALAQWLHGFYSSHAQPFAYKVETLRSICGSGNEKLWSFRQELKEALAELESVAGWKCSIDANDLVIVLKPRKKSLPGKR